MMAQPATAEPAQSLGGSPPARSPADFAEAMALYTTAINEAYKAYYARMQYTFEPPPTVELMEGPKFIRVVCVYKKNASRSVQSFVEKATGNIYKPEGWKKPAKHVRGSIYSESCGAEALTPTGSVRYL